MEVPDKLQLSLWFCSNHFIADCLQSENICSVAGADRDAGSDAAGDLLYGAMVRVCFGTVGLVQECLSFVQFAKVGNDMRLGEAVCIGYSLGMSLVRGHKY